VDNFKPEWVASFTGISKEGEAFEKEKEILDK